MGRRVLFFIIILLLIIENILVQVTTDHVFPFSNYPMYSFKIKKFFVFDVACSSEFKNDYFPSLAIKPHFTKTLTRKVEQWIKENNISKIDQLKQKLTSNLESRTGKSHDYQKIYFKRIFVKKEDYFNYLVERADIDKTEFCLRK